MRSFRPSKLLIIITKIAWVPFTIFSFPASNNTGKLSKSGLLLGSTTTPILALNYDFLTVTSIPYH